MTIAKSLALSLIKEIVADKQKRGIAPTYALRTEIGIALSEAISQLVAEGAITERLASVNRIPAYEIPQAPCQPAL